MDSKGFTIVELLVSAAIFSLIITGMTLALVQQQRQYNITQDIVDVDHTARAALDFIASEVRNAGSRQGKTFSIDFENGGSGVDPQCDNNTTETDIDSPPDCLTVYTWDVTEGRDGDCPGGNCENAICDGGARNGSRCTLLPSIEGTVSVASDGPPLVLNLPTEWFKDASGVDRNPPLIQDGGLIGARSRFNLCYPNPDPLAPIVNCNTEPEKCTECSVILRVDINEQNQAEINDFSDIIEQNFQEDDFADVSTFVTSFFRPRLALQASEITIADAKSFRVDLNDRELEMSQSLNADGDPDQFQPMVGGPDAPGIVDLQLVFNIQGFDGVITKVGVPSDTANRQFANFDELDDWIAAHLPPDPGSKVGNVNDIRSVEIYLVVRSQTRPRKISGGFFGQNIPAIGDVEQKELSDNLPDPVEGYIYRVFSTIVYVRNLAREEFG
ncbi:MAG: PilW family protein [Thermodesulfobacteriota bacterium]